MMNVVIKYLKKTFMVFASILLFLFEMEKIKYIKYDNCTYMKEEKKVVEENGRNLKMR